MKIKIMVMGVMHSRKIYLIHVLDYDSVIFRFELNNKPLYSENNSELKSINNLFY